MTIQLDEPQVSLRAPVFRMSFPNLIEPRAYTDPKTKKKSAPEYSVQMIIEPKGLDHFQMLNPETDEWEKEVNIKKVIRAVADAAWGDNENYDFETFIKTEALKVPLVNGDKVAKERESRNKKGDLYAGNFVLRGHASAKFRPALYTVDGGSYRELDMEKDDEGVYLNSVDVALAKKLFYAGAYGRANLTCKGVESSFGKFVTVYLNGVLFHRDGKRIGGASGEDRFGGIEGGVGDYDPTSELDDEIPF
jgi:hypothetical protein